MHSRPCRQRRPVRRRAGFTLVEIMIVVLIMGVLLNIAAPAFIGARDKAQARSCIKNLSDFATAKEQYAMDSRIPASSVTPVTWANIKPYIKVPPGSNPANGPACPARADKFYNFNPMTSSPTCSYGGPVGNLHVLP